MWSSTIKETRQGRKRVTSCVSNLGSLKCWLSIISHAFNPRASILNSRINSSLFWNTPMQQVVSSLLFYLLNFSLENKFQHLISMLISEITHVATTSQQNSFCEWLLTRGTVSLLTDCCMIFIADIAMVLTAYGSHKIIAKSLWQNRRCIVNMSWAVVTKVNGQENCASISKSLWFCNWSWLDINFGLNSSSEQILIIKRIRTLEPVLDLFWRHPESLATPLPSLSQRTFHEYRHRGTR